MVMTNFLVGLPAMALCLVVQVAVSFWSVQYFVRKSAREPSPRGFLARIGPLVVAMVVMTAGSLVQIAVWATLFVGLGEFDELYEAIYHSAVNFTSLGYGDVVMSRTWKLLGPLEAVNGILMLGMTGGALMAIVQQLIRIQRDALG
jgi:hypothetical protein